MTEQSIATSVVPFTFENFSVRAINRNGDIWFVAADVCAAIDIGTEQIRRLDDDEKGLHLTQTPGGKQEMSIINESGLYALILRSRKAEAKRFRKWVTSEVLPSIRKTGSYKSFIPAVRVLTTIEQTDINMRAHVLAQEKYREIRGELMADYLAGRVDDLDSWVPQDEKKEPFIDVAGLLLFGNKDPELRLPYHLLNAVNKKALDLGKECYELCLVYLKRAIASDCESGTGLDVRMAKDIIRSTSLDNALAQKYFSRIRSMRAHFEVHQLAGQKLLKELDEVVSQGGRQ
ncbi:BRO-N domain-containing protein [Oxalobacter formigenes]